MRPLRGLVLPDLHFPHDDPEAWQPILEYAQSERWDFGLLLGDLMDVETLSDFNSKKPGLLEGKSYRRECDATNTFLDLWSHAVRKRNRAVRLSLIQGNHEERVDRYLDRYPMLRGTLDVPVVLNLKARGVQWVEHWRKGHQVRLGKATFIHGHSTTQNHAAKMVRDYGANVFCGHTHDVQEFSIRRQAKRDSIKGKSLGCLCRFEQDYMQGRPMNWQHAFAVFHFWPDGTFQEETIHIHKGRFVAPVGWKQYGR